MPTSPRSPASPMVAAHERLVGRRTNAALAARGGKPAVRLLHEAGGIEVPLVFGDLQQGAAVGDPLDVFLLTDAKGALIASSTLPLLGWGEVRFLEVTALTDLGAFVDWGLPKELLVPQREQTTRLRLHERYPIALKLDKQGRLLGTNQITELLHQEPAPFALGQWVSGEAWRNDPNIGLFVILEGKWVGRVPPTEPHRQKRGERADYRVTEIYPDGKVELSLRASGATELEGDVERVYEVLVSTPHVRVGDDTSPEQVRTLFGISKKAFKRALGVLFKRGQIEFDAKGFARVIAK